MNEVLTDSDMAGIFQSVTEVSKASAYKINVSFDRRFRIWKTQILPGRSFAIKEEASVEFVHRMMDLLIADGDRLTNRVIFENPDNLISVIVEIDTIMKQEISAYITEIDNIKLKTTEEECKQ